MAVTSNTSMTYFSLYPNSSSISTSTNFTVGYAYEPTAADRLADFLTMDDAALDTLADGIAASEHVPATTVRAILLVLRAALVTTEAVEKLRAR